jgi:hypothetical protein
MAKGRPARPASARSTNGSQFTPIVTVDLILEEKEKEF